MDSPDAAGLNYLYNPMLALFNALRGKQTKASGVQPSEYYDQAFTRPEWREHYTRSAYYFLWTVLVDRVLRSKVRNVLELGCGPGQLACLLRDKGVTRYRGIDFSPIAVRIAREVCPEFSFECTDLTSDQILSTADYDCIVTLEFLEHVEPDLDILSRIRPATRVFASVPDFPYISHVRHFTTEDEVAHRYAALFTEFRVDGFLNGQGKTFYLIEAVKR